MQVEIFGLNWVVHVHSNGSFQSKCVTYKIVFFVQHFIFGPLCLGHIVE